MQIAGTPGCWLPSVPHRHRAAVGALDTISLLGTLLQAHHLVKLPTGQERETNTSKYITLIMHGTQLLMKSDNACFTCKRDFFQRRD